MNGDSLFTSILDLPSTFENPFTVMVEDIVLGEFSNGDEIDFSLYADILGDFLIDGEGVERFTVRTGDAIDPTDPMVLPIKLAFNTETADFSLYAVEGDTETTPEPGMVLGLLSVGALFVGSRLKRK
ncbi:MAG: PEP-CTERM sorting domain-containing protein [Okeania sp. SIO3B3]|nr:PEP-CTERM sorting domain-containing protein [Okeania sp. SIO3B3]